jgi:phage repressor protein C with HTH and peptisase S24 domain
MHDRREPTLKRLQRFAKAFGVTAADLLTPFDVETKEDTNKIEPEPLFLVPLIEWQHLDKYLKASLNTQLSREEVLREVPHKLVEYIMDNPTVTKDHSKDVYAATVFGHSMIPVNSTPDALYPGDRIYIDPNMPPTPDTTVVAEINGAVFLRKFVQDGTRYLLKALNPDPDYKTIEITELSAIKGAVVSVWRRRISYENKS